MILFFSYFKKENKEMSEKRCYTVQELQEILGVSRSRDVGISQFTGEDDEVMKNTIKMRDKHCF